MGSSAFLMSIRMYRNKTCVKYAASPAEFCAVSYVHNSRALLAMVSPCDSSQYSYASNDAGPSAAERQQWSR